MDKFRRGTLIAALVLTAIVVVVPPYVVRGRDMGAAALIVLLMLVAIWGTRLGANAVYRGIHEKGQEDEPGANGGPD